MLVEAQVPGELVVEFRPGLRIAVGRIERRNQDAVHRSFDVAALRIRGIAGQPGSREHRLTIAGENGNAVPGGLAPPDGTVTGRLDRGSRKLSSVALSSCRQTTSGSAVPSQVKRMSSRLFTPLMLKVAIFMRSSRREAIRPSRNRLGQRLQVICGREARDCLARLEVVVAVLQPEKFDPVGQGVSRNLVAGAEFVAGPLTDQCRRLEIGKMSGAQLVRFSGGMEGIAEAKEPGDLALGMKVVGDHAGDATAHGLAADHEGALGAELGNGRPILRIERFRAGRGLAPVGSAPGCHIAELEAGDAKTHPASAMAAAVIEVESIGAPLHARGEW